MDGLSFENPRIEFNESDSVIEPCPESRGQHGNHQGTIPEFLVSQNTFEAVSPVGGAMSPGDGNRTTPMRTTNHAVQSNFNRRVSHPPRRHANCEPSNLPIPTQAASPALNNVIQSLSDITLQRSGNNGPGIQGKNAPSKRHASRTIVINKCQNLQIGSHNTMIVSQTNDRQSDSSLSDSSDTSSESDSS